MRLLVNKVWFLRSHWISGRGKGRIIISSSFLMVCKVHSLSVFNMLDKGSTSFNSRGTPTTGVWSHSKIPEMSIGLQMLWASN